MGEGREEAGGGVRAGARGGGGGARTNKATRAPQTSNGPNTAIRNATALPQEAPKPVEAKQLPQLSLNLRGKLSV